MPNRDSQATLNTTELLAHAELTAESARTALSRSLHDELGGLLVAAVMDTAWAEQHLDSNEDVRLRLQRVRQSLAAAIDLKRKMIEELRPTLLDNFGLFAALRWQLKHQIEGGSISCTEQYPSEEPVFSSDASIILFRIIQEVLLMSWRQRSAKSAHLGLEINEGSLTIHIRHDGDIITAAERDDNDVVSSWLIEHRIRGLGGQVFVSNPQAGGMTLKAEIPLEKIIAAATR